MVFLLLFFCLSFGIIFICYLFYELTTNNAKKSDVILVLGALPTIKGTNIINPCLVERVKHASKLLHDKYASKIILSGGNRANIKKKESSVMREIAIKEGINKREIIIESEAGSTYENIMNTKKIMMKHNFLSVIIVSDIFHLPRAALVARKLKINFTLSPAIESPCSQTIQIKIKYLFTEILAILVYKMLGKI